MSQATSEQSGQDMGGSAASSYIGLGLALLFIIGILTSKMWLPLIRPALDFLERSS